MAHVAVFIIICKVMTVAVQMEETNLQMKGSL